MIRALTLFAAVPAVLSMAQPTSQPAFEVAAVKLNTTVNAASNWSVSPGRLRVVNMHLKSIIEAAYSVQDYQFAGPAWLENERYDIDAKPEGKAESGKQLLLMLQALLAERFKLAIHRETKLVSGYALTVAKGGLKIRPSEGEGSSLNSKNRDTKLTATRVGMPQLAKFLAGVLAQPVVDETNVADRFDFVLEFADPRLARQESGDAAVPLPSVFTVLTEQLGVRLEPRKVPVEVLVVDRAQRLAEE